MNQLLRANATANQSDVDREGCFLPVGLDVDFQHLADGKVGQLTEDGNGVTTHTGGWARRSIAVVFVVDSSFGQVINASTFQAGIQTTETVATTRNRQSETIRFSRLHAHHGSNAVGDAVNNVVSHAAFGVQLVQQTNHVNATDVHRQGYRLQVVTTEQRGQRLHDVASIRQAHDRLVHQYDGFDTSRLGVLDQRTGLRGPHRVRQFTGHVKASHNVIHHY
ncbi:hypothetical protein D3C73_926180 [compost metagenome]